MSIWSDSPVQRSARPGTARREAFVLSADKQRELAQAEKNISIGPQEVTSKSTVAPDRMEQLNPHLPLPKTSKMLTSCTCQEGYL